MHHRIVEKGSIAIDGISLTVASVDSREFAVSVIPHTASATTLIAKSPGDTVNLENDITGKYIEKLLGLNNEKHTAESGVTMEFLQKHGF